MLPPHMITAAVNAALAEDMGRMGDLTSRHCLPVNAKATGHIVARQDGVLAGLPYALATFRALDPRLSFDLGPDDGQALADGDRVLTISGPAQSLFAAERVALNFLGHLSGVASLTRKYVEAVAHTNARIAATRKTLPGLRTAQKYAVELGGGLAHRYGLDDAILIKDNHIAAHNGDLVYTLTRAQAQAGHLTAIEIEVDTLDQFRQIKDRHPHAILLDNFSSDDLRTAVAERPDCVVLEASGGVTLETVAAIADTGVDVISVGALTHSAPNFDFGLDVI